MHFEQSSNVFNEEICNLIDSIKPNQKEKVKNFSRMRQLEIIPEDRAKQNKAVQKGLTENILNDFETKEKARKGLLFLLNKISQGSICPEITDYFSQAKKENLQKKKELAMSNKKEEEKYSPLNKIGSNLPRQNLVEGTRSVTKFRVSQEDIFKLNSDNPKTIVNSKVEKPNDKFIPIEKEKVTLILKKKKDGEDKKLQRADRFLPDKKYRNDISAMDKEFKLYFSDNEDKNPKLKSKGKKKYLGVNTYNKIKKKSKKEDQRVGVQNSIFGIDGVKQNNNFTKAKCIDRDFKKNFSIGSSEDS